MSHTDPAAGKFVLAIDCSSKLLCVAVSGPGMSAEAVSEAGHSHAEILIPAIDTLLTSNGLGPGDIGGVVCGKGPGSFTGLRIAMATAKGIAEALGLPMLSIPAMDAVASLYADWDGPVMVVTDARKNRFYGGLYVAGRRQGDFLDLSAGELYQRAITLRTRGDQKVLATGPDIADLELALKNGTEDPGPALQSEAAGGREMAAKPGESGTAEKTAEPGVVDEPGHIGASLHIVPFDETLQKRWALKFVTAGAAALARGERDTPESAPLYIRNSDAELGITKPKKNVRD